MKIQFTKEGPAGIPKGLKLDKDESFAQRMIDGGYAKKLDDNDPLKNDPALFPTRKEISVVGQKKAEGERDEVIKGNKDAENKAKKEGKANDKAQKAVTYKSTSEEKEAENKTPLQKKRFAITDADIENNEALAINEEWEVGTMVEIEEKNNGEWVTEVIVTAPELFDQKFEGGEIAEIIFIRDEKKKA